MQLLLLSYPVVFKSGISLSSTFPTSLIVRLGRHIDLNLCVTSLVNCFLSVIVGTSGLITASCSLHSDATLDVSSDSEFIAVLQPSDNGSYSAVGIYSLRDETLGASLYTYHFDQNTVSVSISPSCDYIVVGYAGRGPFYRIVHPSRNIGQVRVFFSCLKLKWIRDQGTNV